jgi:hypothetical protein
VTSYQKKRSSLNPTNKSIQTSSAFPQKPVHPFFSFVQEKIQKSKEKKIQSVGHCVINRPEGGEGPFIFKNEYKNIIDSCNCVIV